MLTNLLKYEFKASGRVVLPIASGVLVLNIFTGILSHFIQNTSDRFPLAGLALVLLNLAALVSLLVVLAVCFFIEVQQFYRLLGDRGYLMLACRAALEAYCRQGYLRHGVDRVRYVIFFRLLCTAYRRFCIQRPSC